MKNKIKKHVLIFFAALLPLSFSFQSCENTDDAISALQQILDWLLSRTGWLVNDENYDNVPDDIAPFDGDDSLPSSILLESYFPPIGDQGQYGTCVTWSTGYNLKTALNALESGWNQSELSAKANQTSPKDLWMAISSDDKGKNCEGTNFEYAFGALQTTGAASMATVPYSSMGNCSGNARGDANNKLVKYRKIAYNESGKKDGMDLNNFKGYLNNKQPIAIGAKLGDRFMDWKDASVITYDTYNNPGMQHAYHAMVLVGYDDSKQAFRVRNSWGSTWGDNGSIWIGYDFFMKEFCFAAYVAYNTNDTNSNSKKAKSANSSADVMVYTAADNQVGADPLKRSLTYAVYNSGQETIYPSQDWSVVYLYYNASKAGDYEILFEDRYTNQYGKGNGSLSSMQWWNNETLHSGKMLGEDVYGSKGFKVNYTIPAITGKYYLVVIADPYDKIDEANENNNFYFVTATNKEPIEFNRGVMKNVPVYNSIKQGSKPSLFANTETQTPIGSKTLNAYAPDEIKAMLIHDKKSGTLDAKIKKYQAQKTTTAVKLKVE
jgi:hypothetical protein